LLKKLDIHVIIVKNNKYLKAKRGRSSRLQNLTESRLC